MKHSWSITNPPANAGNTEDTGWIPGSGRSPGGVNGKPTPVFLPGKFHGQGSLAGYSPWGHNLATEHTHIWDICDTAERMRGLEWSK